MTAYLVDRWLNRDRSDRGASAVEYGLTIALIVIVLAGVVVLLGADLSA